MPSLWWVHRRRSGWTSGGTHGECRRWVRVEWGGIRGGVSPLQPTKGSGGASWAPPAGSKTRFWRILKALRTLIFVPIWQNLGGGGICISVPPLQILGGRVPPVFPVIYAHGWVNSTCKSSTSVCVVKSLSSFVLLLLSASESYQLMLLAFRSLCAAFVWVGDDAYIPCRM